MVVVYACFIIIQMTFKCRKSVYSTTIEYIVYSMHQLVLWHSISTGRRKTPSIPPFNTALLCVCVTREPRVSFRFASSIVIRTELNESCTKIRNKIRYNILLLSYFKLIFYFFVRGLRTVFVWEIDRCIVHNDNNNCRLRSRSRWMLERHWSMLCVHFDQVLSCSLLVWTRTEDASLRQSKKNEHKKLYFSFLSISPLESHTNMQRMQTNHPALTPNDCQKSRKLVQLTEEKKIKDEMLSQNTHTHRTDKSYQCRRSNMFIN